MGFTTPCFIRKQDTTELRNKLNKLGYFPHPTANPLYNNRNGELHTGRGFYANLPIGYIEEINNAIDCGTNEELFLAIAALRDDTSANQYWVFDYDFPPHYKKGDFTIGYFHRCSCYCHVATVEELIEHFK